MRLRDYFVGQPVVLRSSLSKDEVKRRINSATPPWYWRFQNGVRGKVWFDRVRLSYTALWFFDYNAKPILAGTLVDTFGSTTLDARYRAPAFAFLFFGFWFLFTIFFGGALFVAWLDERLEPGGWIGFPVVGLFLVVPIVMHYAFNRGADDHLDAILEFLASEADFRRELEI